MKMLKKIGYFSAFIVLVLVALGSYLGSWAYYIPSAFVFIFIPLLDYRLGLDTTNTPQEIISETANDYYYRFITFLWAWCQLAMVIWGCYWVATHPLQWFEWMGFVLGVSLATGGIGITVGHELGHKKEEIERFYARMILMTVCYMHFYIEHNRGHHVQVSTPADPATSRKGEHFYAFWWRSVSQSYMHAWHLENQRMVKNKRAHFHYSNQMIWSSVLPILFCGIITLFLSLWAGSFAWQVPLFFFSQSILAFTLLELVNYIEHYGLMRKEVSPGRYEPVNHLHSWNNSHMVSNFFLFQLQRHSDHHAHSIKRYQVLDHYDDSPQLPAGYPTMIMIALFPPLWFKIMDPRLLEWKKMVLKEVA